VRKAENASGKTHTFCSTTHQWVHHSHRPRRAAARRSKANTVTPRAQSRREDCSVAAAAATVLLLLLLLLLPLHLSSTSRCPATPQLRMQSTVSPPKPGACYLSACIDPLRRFRRSTGTLGSCLDGGGGEKPTVPTAPVSRLGVPGARGGEGRRGEGCSALAK